jgi:hypothetical protein
VSTVVAAAVFVVAAVVYLSTDQTTGKGSIAPNQSSPTVVASSPR